jgi:chromosomal replication initiation ATPase DnaA
MSPELRDDLEVAAETFEKLRAEGKESADAFLSAVRTYRALRTDRQSDQEPSAPLWAHGIVAEVARRHGISAERLCSRMRERHLAAAREEAIWMLRQRGLSTLVIGAAMNRDHSTVVYTLAKLRKRMESDELLRERMARAVAA